MSDEHRDTMSRAPIGPETASSNPTTPTPAAPTAAPTAEAAETALGPDGAAKKRRRRGSRGGRNRRKPGSSQGNQNEGGPNSGGANRAPGRTAPKRDADAGERQPHDYTDAEADRGLTSEDLAADAREDAGLAPPTRPLTDAPR